MNIQDLEKFLDSDQARSCDKCAFVVPVYEISQDLSPGANFDPAAVPADKAELLGLVSRGKARQFHQVRPFYHSCSLGLMKFLVPFVPS